MPRNSIKHHLTAGQRFRCLTLIERVPACTFPDHRARWRCQCDCGKECLVVPKHLVTANTSSCGCLRERIRPLLKSRLKHGMSHLPEYTCWRNMIKRCCDAQGQQFPNYGGRGITVCSRWMEFENFYADMGSRPSGDYSLDRINNDGNYEPDNCRWATRIEQNRNQRQKTHCIHGHEFTPENTYYARQPNGRTRRHCRTCTLESHARGQSREKARAE